MSWRDEKPPGPTLEIVPDSVQELIPLARPSLGDDEAEAVAQVLASGRLVLGPENQRFEKALATLAGRRHAVCVTSGTTALEMALWALDVPWPALYRVPGTWKGSGPSPEDMRPEQFSVIVPAGGFPAAANAVLRLGGLPVPVDIDPRTWTLDIEAAAHVLDDTTSGRGDPNRFIDLIISIDTFGVVAESEPLESLAEHFEAALIDDAACSLGGRDSRDVPGGGYGIAGTFSFHPRKLVTTGEGGAVVCDDDDLASRLREVRNQGQSFNNAGRVRRFVRSGSNGRLSEIAAAIGNVQLARLGPWLRERELLCAGYRERLADARDKGLLFLQEIPETARPACQTFAVLLAKHIDRDRVQAHMAAAGVETGVALFSLSRLDCYARLPGIGDRRFPVAEALHDRGLALPLYSGLRSAELDRISESLLEALA